MVLEIEVRILTRKNVIRHSPLGSSQQNCLEICVSVEIFALF